MCRLYSLAVELHEPILDNSILALVPIFIIVFRWKVRNNDDKNEGINFTQCTCRFVNKYRTLEAIYYYYRALTHVKQNVNTSHTQRLMNYWRPQLLMTILRILKWNILDISVSSDSVSDIPDDIIT